MMVVIGASIAAPGFLTYTNITNTLIAASITAVTGLGMTFAIAMGGFDLSVGSVQVLTGILVAGLLAMIDPPLALLAALLTGLALGLVNGVLISKLKLPAFVVTFGMMSIVRGIALLVTQGESVMITRHVEFGLLNNGKIFGIPLPFLVMGIVFVVLSILLKHTPFGRHACAVGGNRSAAIVSGINIDRTTIAVFGLVGVTAAISGVMLSAQLMIIDATLGTGFELQAITVSVLGGTSLSGGHGNLLGTIFAAPSSGDDRQRVEYSKGRRDLSIPCSRGIINICLGARHRATRADRQIALKPCVELLRWIGPRGYEMIWMFSPLIGFPPLAFWRSTILSRCSWLGHNPCGG